MADVIRIDGEELENFNARARTFGFAALALEFLGIFMLVISIPIGLALCLTKCLALVVWGNHLMSTMPFGGEMGDYEDVLEIAS